ncbi:MAG TPA: cobalamin B12-binding domain-containing protein [Verrucomicrobiae bacterium]|nr:cobalamin B12-binding domain-containing protein [Verrucomicrobiae bacterium]
MHPIGYVAARTGLSPYVIRVWELRYKAVTPARTDTNRRVYSDEDIERLILLRKGTAAGHRISQLSKLPLDRLRAIAEASVNRPLSAATPVGDVSLGDCINVVQQLDARALERLLGQATMNLSHTAIIQTLIVPLTERIGALWQDGQMRPAHEHLATAVIRSFVGNITEAYQPEDNAPRMIVSTPAGQWHELGALVVTATAAAQGWRVTYLGPNLPADDIAAAATQTRASVVGLSIVYPGDDPNVGHELRKLRRVMGAQVTLLVGGRAAGNYQRIIEEVGAIRINDIPQLRLQLDSLRTTVN